MAIIFPRGTIFGPYTIGDLLGVGLVSEVYEARIADGTADGGVVPPAETAAPAPHRGSAPRPAPRRGKVPVP
jgi:hypothetical protein